MVLLPADFSKHLDRIGQMGGAASPTGGADQHRNAGLFGGLKDKRQVPLIGNAIGKRFADAEVVRPRIGGAGIDADGVGLALHPLDKRAFRNAVAKHAAGGENGGW